MFHWSKLFLAQHEPNFLRADGHIAVIKFHDCYSGPNLVFNQGSEKGVDRYCRKRKCLYFHSPFTLTKSSW